jgi:hypothetical protein
VRSKAKHERSQVATRPATRPEASHLSLTLSRSPSIPCARSLSADEGLVAGPRQCGIVLLKGGRSILYKLA